MKSNSNPTHMMVDNCGMKIWYDRSLFRDPSRRLPHNPPTMIKGMDYWHGPTITEILKFLRIRQDGPAIIYTGWPPSRQVSPSRFWHS